MGIINSSLFGKKKKKTPLPPEPPKNIGLFFKEFSKLIYDNVENVIGVHLLLLKDKTLFPVFHKNIEGEIDDEAVLPLSHGIFGFPILEQKPIVINHFYHDLKIIAYYKNPPEIGAIAVIPLDNHGVMVIEKEKTSGFNQEELKFLKDFLKIFIDTITLSKNLKESERSADKFYTLYNLSASFMSTLDKTKIIEKCLKALDQLYSPTVSAFIKNKDDFPYSSGKGGKKIFYKGSIIEWLFEHQGLLFKNDLDKSGFFRHWENVETVTMLGQSSNSGVLWVEWDYKKDLDEKEKDLFKFAYNLFTLVLKNVEYYEKIEMLSIRDGLTTLYNHRMFHEYMDREIQKKQPFGLLLIDIDHFKKVNDTYGHPFGDKVLKRISGILKNFSELSFRYGGEEFAVIINGEKKEIIEKAEELRSAIEKEDFHRNEKIIHVTVSIGLSFYPENGVRRDILIKSSDKALYFAKEHGRNKVIMYEEGI